MDYIHLDTSLHHDQLQALLTRNLSGSQTVTGQLTTHKTNKAVAARLKFVRAVLKMKTNSDLHEEEAQDDEEFNLEANNSILTHSTLN